MPGFMDIVGPVISDTFYVENQLAAKDVTITLPEVTPLTADLQAAGTLTMPVWQLLDNMTMTITKIGVDMGLRRMITPQPTSMESRWVQTVTDANGATKNVGCKAFVRGVPTSIPGISLTPGEAGENECSITVWNYRLVVDGIDYINVGRFSNKLVIAGVDLANYQSML